MAEKWDGQAGVLYRREDGDGAGDSGWGVFDG